MKQKIYIVREQIRILGYVSLYLVSFHFHDSLQQYRCVCPVDCPLLIITNWFETKSPGHTTHCINKKLLPNKIMADNNENNSRNC